MPQGRVSGATTRPGTSGQVRRALRWADSRRTTPQKGGGARRGRVSACLWGRSVTHTFLAPTALGLGAAAGRRLRQPQPPLEASLAGQANQGGLAAGLFCLAMAHGRGRRRARLVPMASLARFLRTALTNGAPLAHCKAHVAHARAHASRHAPQTRNDLLLNLQSPRALLPLVCNCC